MSFLAQLRQPQSDVDGIKLCYLFKFDPIKKHFNLLLSLAELKNNQLVELVGPYIIQPSHLKNLPSFIQANDHQILNYIIKHHSITEGCQQQSGEITVPLARAVLIQMLATNRCFWLNTEQQWQPIETSPSIKIELEWQINGIGDYQLKWIVSRTTTNKLLHKLHCYTFQYNQDAVLIFNVEKKSWALPQIEYTDEVLNFLDTKKRQIPLVNLAGYLTQYESYLIQHHVPLPKAVPIIENESLCTPVLKVSNFKQATQYSAIQEGGLLTCGFRYQNENFAIEVAADTSSSAIQYWDGKQLVQWQRDLRLEQQWLNQLESYLYQPDNQLNQQENRLNQFNKLPHSLARWYCVSSQSWYKFFTHHQQKLVSAGFQIHIASEFKFHFVQADNWQVELTPDKNKDLSISFTATIKNEKILLNELLQQLQAFNQQQYDQHAALTLADGRLLLFSADKLTSLLDELGDLFSQQGKLILPHSQFYRLQQIEKGLPEQTQWSGSIESLELARSLYQQPAFLEQISSSVNATLRSYQWLGVCWLQHLKRHQINGLLADDMGLGKTLQTIAHLSVEFTQNPLNNPALIVAPKSLLHNWASEINRFAPHLKYKIVQGSQRKKNWSSLNNYQILITSYQLANIDSMDWQQHALSWIILDEAQQIKNYRTQISQSLRQISSEYRLCLSGTPVENHLGELWSILDFLMPGCLGKLKAFKQHFQKPIESDADENKMQLLKQRIAPFMLRRTKQQVADDLPEKTEIYQSIILSDEQMMFYQQQKDRQQTHLQEQMLASENDGQKQILLLTALLKLRQACCDPALLDEMQITSAKRQHCLQMVEELVAEKRKILIFSQFTQMLDLLASDLKDKKISHLILTGKTQHRQQLVDKFQQGNTSVFLISLKAGGVGLNLTQADTVIHYDPWWNSAAEQQASDRAHRIGQKNPVFVYKLIAQDTIEEKIALLQQHKAQLSQHINHQAQLSGEKFALKLEDLMTLWQQEIE
ncbi:DEAD/DEAH box helicase [Aliikangiella maris]|uniref:DEAD/DEAH box helicase n=2 Tax=Aliikangiella maris TaxID=3162458 RepID=A0ABV2BZF9_9GAMM